MCRVMILVLTASARSQTLSLFAKASAYITSPTPYFNHLSISNPPSILQTSENDAQLTEKMASMIDSFKSGKVRKSTDLSRTSGDWYRLRPHRNHVFLRGSEETSKRARLP